ncbi:Gfo/Idh/MocA family oxidoreductase [Nocardioides koreensis]|uniref:Gfo/Idh/MocA family protein n=1 Tax=Nocardioides koreensis TaxID=433651 RepID=UPI0031E4920F
MAPVGLGLVGAGGFATFLAEAAATLPSVSLRAVADPRPDAARRLAGTHAARATGSWQDLLTDGTVDAVVVATPPADHATIATAALEAGKHVFCEKPLALDDAAARDLVAVVERTERVLVVDHVLRYNPLLRALAGLRGSLLGPVQRFCFENDASDEDLGPNHWFWDEARSGGIFVEHGVHFFDAAAMLLDHEPTSVGAVEARRRHGAVDLVSATVMHGGDTLATHTHSFTHAHRCERQLMRLDCGPAEVRVEGWIPVHAVVDAWTDEAGLEIAEGLPDRVPELFDVPGFRLGPAAGIRVSGRRDAAAPGARGRGVALDVPHHVRVELTLGGHDAKPAAYAESVRAALTDLVSSITDGGRPRSGVREGAAAVAVATAATRSARNGRVEPLAPTHVPVH